MTRQLFLEDALLMPLQDVLRVMQEKVTRSTYFGIPTMKLPLDFWIYQEIISELKPDLIVEIGNWYGGSTLALAHLCDQLPTGRVLAIDKDQKNISSVARKHDRIKWVEAEACEVVDLVKEEILEGEKVLVIDDSSHAYHNTLSVLRCFSPFVSIGSYFIVEDSICGHGLDVGIFPGPYEAVQEFLKENKNFVADRSREPYLITWNPSGYLKRVS